MDAMSGTDSLNETLSQLHHSMSVLKEAEANPNHRLYSLHTRFIEYNLMENAVKTQLGRVASFLEEHEHWAHVHQRTLSLLFSQSQRQLTKWLGDAAGVSTNTGATSALVRDFLEKAGQAALLEQFEAAESAFCIAIEKQKQAVLACAQLLRHYANVACLYPASYRQRHRNILYARWARRLAESFTVATCQSVGVEFAAEFAEEESTDEERRVKRHRVLTTHFQLDNIAQEVSLIRAVRPSRVKDSFIPFICFPDQLPPTELDVALGQGKLGGGKRRCSGAPLACQVRASAVCSSTA